MGRALWRAESSGDLHKSLQVHSMDHRERNVLIGHREIANQLSINLINIFQLSLEKHL